MTPTEIRLRAAREYIDEVMQLMGGYCTDAFVFGSVARGDATDKSDLDVLLVVKRPTREERFSWNANKER